MNDVIDSPQPTTNESAISQTIAYAEAALTKARELPAAENPQIASQMIELGDLYRETNELEKTAVLYKEALEIIEQHASDTPGVYQIAHEIGAIYDSLGDIAQSQTFYAEALRLAADGSEVDACEIATIHNNLALTHKAVGNLPLAEAHYHKALEIYERVRGPEHPEVASMLNNLGALYIAQNDLDMAEVMHLRALNLRQKAFGDSHPDVAQSFSNLAVVYHSRENWKKAGGYYRDALDVLARQSRIDWDEYSIVLRNYADFLRQTGKDKKADELEAEIQSHR